MRQADAKMEYRASGGSVLWYAMTVELSFWQVTIATFTLFIFWTITLLSGAAWLNSKFNSLLRRDDYDLRHAILDTRLTDIQRDLIIKFDNFEKYTRERIRSLELWAASRGVNGPESYKFQKIRED